MQLRELGRSGIKIAPLMFGGNVFGWTADERTSFAILDAWVICAATIALGAAFVWHGLAGGVSAASLFTLNRPLLGIVTLVLLAFSGLIALVALLAYWLL